MPAELTPDIDPSDIGATIHDTRSGSPEALRSSETRRNLLETFGAILSDGDIDLNFKPTDGETAHVELGSTPPTVYIPTWEFDQPVTEIGRKIYDLLIQQTLTVHEIGHVNYTDNAAFGQAKQSLPPEEQDAFHTLFNVLEDGAIENQLRQAFNVADQIAVTNANFRFSYNQDHRTYDMLAATQLAGLDLAVFDSGILGDLLDPAEKPEFDDTETRRTFQQEVLPKLAQTSSDVLSEPDGERRVELILELWRDIREHFDSLTPPDQLPSPKGSVPAGGSGQAADGASADALGDSSSAGNESSGSADSSGKSSGDAAESTEGSSSENEEDTNQGSTSGNSSQSTAETTGASDSTEGANEDETSGSDNSSDPDHGEEPHQEDGSENDTPSSEDGSSDQDSTSISDGSDKEDSDSTTPESDTSEGESSSSDSTEDADKDAASAGGDSESNPSPSSTTPSTGADESKDSTDRDDSSDSGRDQAGGGSGGGASDGEDTKADGDIHERARRAASEVDSKVKEQEDLEEEIREGYEEAAEEFIDSLDRTTRRKLTIETPTEPLGDESDRWRDIRRDGEQLGRIFDQQLKNERRSSRKRHQRRGRLDPRSLTQLQQGNPRIFQSDDSPDEKEYAIVLVLDRSGSMSSDILVAEQALAVLAYALESVGVDVCIIEMHRSQPKVAKPLTVDLEDVPSTILTGKTGGGTPLSDVLAVARERVAGADYEPAMIVVTDGKPKNRDAYRAELQQTRFPVLGVYIDLAASSRDRVISRAKEDVAHYDQRAIVIQEAELLDTLESMAREVVF